MADPSIEDELKEIDRWLEPSEPSEFAERAYKLWRGNHRGGEFPKFCRVEWAALPKDYRTFLIWIAVHAVVSTTNSDKLPP